jgi:hypothetical protein
MTPDQGDPMHANASLPKRNRGPKSREIEVEDIPEAGTMCMYTARGRLEDRLRQAFADRVRQSEVLPQSGGLGQATVGDWRKP